MFCVIYEFTIKNGQENNFQKYWHLLTLEIKRKYHGLGSRLHRQVGGDNKWIAYAQWPTRETWLYFRQAILNDVDNAFLSEQMRCTYHSAGIVCELDVTDDLLENPHQGVAAK